MNKKQLYITAATLLLASPLFFLKNSDAIAESAPSQPQAVPVSVATVDSKEVDIWSEFSGRLTAVDIVEIRPRVSGTIDKILFTEGSEVKQGQALFVIDTKPYEAELSKAEAALATATAQASLAETEMSRAEKLITEGTITRREYDSRANNKKVAEGNIKSAEAAVKLARLNLSYANIKSPITGIISRAEITAGNLIEAGPNAPILASVVSNKQIYAEFSVDEQTYLRLNSSKTEGEKSTEIPVEISLNGNGEVVKGFIKSFDNKLDISSGTIRARAIFDNPEGKLIPGLFAKVCLGSSAKQNAILISDKAISTDQNKKFVYIVTPENKVAYREIKISGTVNGLRIVDDGLKIGEKIIVQGIQKVRPEAVVAPEEVPMSQE